MVDGYVNGKRIRVRCKTEQEALMRKSEQETSVINAERAMRFVQTRLTAGQTIKAETAFDRLGTKYALSTVVDYFLRHHHAPDFTIAISDASARFRTAIRRLVSRDRSRSGQTCAGG
jgi:hypothetical protein